MGPMNNPIFQMINIMRQGGNPRAFMGHLAQQNPQVNQFMQMMNGKTPQQLQQMAQNVAKERGTTVNQVAQMLGIDIPGGR